MSVRSLGLSGISGYEVTVECFLSGGLPAFDVVGLPDTAVREARERVRAAVKNCGARFPVSRITVNLAPANQRKEGTVYDLPILLGLLTASEELPPLPEDAAFLGELSLTGALRPVAGVLPMALCAARCGNPQALFVPAGTPPRPRWPTVSPCTRWRRSPSCWRISGARRPSRRRSGGSPPARRCPCRTFPRSWDRRT